MLPLPRSYVVAVVVLLATFIFALIVTKRLRRRRTQHHFPLRTPSVEYIYTATVIGKPGQPTYLDFPSPPSPFRDKNTQTPTILRVFPKELAGLSHRPARPKSSVKFIDLTKVPLRTTRPRVTVVQRLTQPMGRSVSRHQESLPVPQRDRDESQPPDLDVSHAPQAVDLGADPSRPIPGPSRIPLCPAQSLDFEQRERSISPSELSESSSGRGSLNEDVDINYLVRHERSPRPVSTKPDVIKTYWWETKAPERILSPPNLSRHRELCEGDIFVHRSGTYLTNGGERQDLWIWTLEQGTTNLHWKPIKQGYKRGDGRVLALTEGRKLPSWLDRKWYLKRLAQDRL